MGDAGGRAVTSSIQAPAPAARPVAGAGPAPVELAPRERAALTAAASGLTSEAAARRMGMSPRTLRRAQREAANRLGVPTLIQALALAADAGLIDMTHVRDGTLPDWPEAPKRRPAGRSAERRTRDPSPARTAAAAAAGRAGSRRRVAERAARMAKAAPLFEEGLSLGEVAERLGVAVGTAYTYRREWRVGGSG